MATPLIHLDNISKTYHFADRSVAVLDGVSLAIERGEMVAIVGASGSGKSTLLNILGCLDIPSAGCYRFAGRPVDQHGPDRLAQLRRDHIGFVFQRYHLLADFSALTNVEMPALYADMAMPARRQRALHLLAQLGLSEHAGKRPHQLSGGQQQRVSLARALMNGGEVILADEPTGALDRQAGEEVMRLLCELHAQGHTIILVTHDPDIAKHAERIIEVAEGKLVGERRQLTLREELPRTASALEVNVVRTVASGWLRQAHALRLALLVMAVHPLRTFLTMLGIVIGVVSVILMIAVGEGVRQQVLANVSLLGTHTIELWAGREQGDTERERLRGLKASDAQALAEQPYLAGASPVAEASLQIRYGNRVVQGSVIGVNEHYPAIVGLHLARGRWFDHHAVTRRTQSVVLDPAASRTLFGTGDPIGRIVMLGGMPAQVIGVTETSPTSRWPGQNLTLFVPYTVVTDRLTGKSSLSSVIVRIADTASSAAAEPAVLRLLALLRGDTDVFLQNADGVVKAQLATAHSMALLISAIACISLLVGGLGVMNIMLVAVAERTQEVGVRMAVGARRSDIQRQFLTESVMVCVVAGVVGMLLAVSFGAALHHFGFDVALVYRPEAFIGTFACVCLTGVVFGYWPARNAARLDPVVALSRE